MASSRLVGPDLPSGLRRPGRSVSLPSPELQRMGFNFDEFDRLVSEGVSEAEQNSWDLVEDPETGELVERGEQSDGRWWPPLGVENWVPAYEEDGLLRGIAGGEDWALDQLAEGRRRQGEVGAIEDLTVDEIDRLRDRAEAELGRRRNEGVGRTLPPEEISAEAAGLTADEAFQQHQATSGVGAMAGAGAMAGMNAARRINPNQGELPGTGGPREQLEGAKGQVQPRTPAEQKAYEEALRKASGQRSPAPAVPPPVPPPVSPMAGREPWPGQQKVPLDVVGEPDLVPPPREPWPGQQKVPLDVMNPEARSMDSQMLADLMAERAAQPEQGYFGGMGNAVQELTETVRAMSGEEQGMMIAALIAAGLLTAGSGGMLAPAGAALMGGAGMAALSQ